ncbi:MAG: hypothetical protein H6667_22490 [Ardenticatenaceae bacterium]|nr:hypothetical protein [Ardenticatenaceae bacterium]MCB9444792.1 hypothetical protein [Ardenticatenaceae bacterium]
MKTKISTKLLIVLLCTSVIPLFIAGFIGYRSSRNITDIATEANQDIATLAMSDSMSALSHEKEIDLTARTEGIAGDINDILTRVEADTAELAYYATLSMGLSDGILSN